MWLTAESQTVSFGVCYGCNHLIAFCQHRARSSSVSPFRLNCFGPSHALFLRWTLLSGECYANVWGASGIFGHANVQLFLFPFLSIRKVHRMWVVVVCCGSGQDNIHFVYFCFPQRQWTPLMHSISVIYTAKWFRIDPTTLLGKWK